MADPLATFNDFVGQPNMKRQLALAISSALTRGVPLDHVLLVGPPGFGKTMLANIIANEMYENYETFFMPIEPKILQALMAEYQGVVLLDEIHRAPPKQQELLLTVLNDGYFQTKGGLRVENELITFIGATTEGDKIVDAVRDRFPIRPVFDPYTNEDMAEIILRMAAATGVEIPRKAAFRLGRASLGVPRNAQMIVNTWRDLSLQGGQVDPNRVLRALRLTDTGLSAEHIRYCEYLARAGGTAGLDLLRQLLSMPSGAIERLEVDLIKQGMLERQSSGRYLTGKGFELAGISRFGGTPTVRRNNRGR